jgi:hypothetical protein
MLRFTWRSDSKKKAKILRPVTFPPIKYAYIPLSYGPLG